MILFRVDANEKIGTGHVMRCMSIAHAFSNIGKEVLFVTSDHRPDTLIAGNGFASVCLNCPWNDVENDGIHTVIEKYNPELLIVDSYFLTENYMQRVSREATTAYIDDMNLMRWDVDYLINYNVFGELMDYSNYAKTKTKVILGMRYAPLRSEFRDLGEHKIKDAADILVSAGGSDPERMTERIMQTVCRAWRNIRFHFVVGTLNPRIREIQFIAKKTENAVLHIHEKDMAGLMKTCDLAVSAAGSTLYELCACGTPTVSYTLADNQLLLAEGFAERGVMYYAGDCRKDEKLLSEIIRFLEDLIDDPVTRKRISKKMQYLVDGKGAERIVHELTMPRETLNRTS